MKDDKYISHLGKKYVKFSYFAKNRKECLDYIGVNKWQVKEDSIYFIDYENTGAYIIIPAGFITDFGSIPCFVRCIGEKDEYVAYIIHDYLYSIDGYMQCKGEDIGEIMTKLRKYGYNVLGAWLYTRKFADKLLENMLNIESIEIYRKSITIKKYLIYLAVRIAGFTRFRK